MKASRGLLVWRCLSLAWVLFLSVVYFWPSDILYAVTIWPPFVWAGLGVLLALVGIRRHRSKPQIYLIAAWIVFWLGFGDEKRWLIDRVGSVPEAHLVVVSLNCAGGSIEAAAEAFKVNPDIILFQESPSEKELRKLAEKYFGKDYGIVAGVDASIIVKGGALR
ncbi:MAG: hypothetical protein H7Y17_03475, partial [Chlorobia bacterium]|nr:hypothetical protein [Fimbriimonadaceae bacterium]